MKIKVKSFLGVLFFGSLLLLLIIFTPLAFIWSINTLCGTSIPFNFWTWLSVVVIKIFISSNVK